MSDYKSRRTESEFQLLSNYWISTLHLDVRLSIVNVPAFIRKKAVLFG